MKARGLPVLISLVALLLPAALALATPRDPGSAAASQGRPRIESGRYGEGDVYLDVNVKARTVAVHFTLYCRDPFASQYVTSGPKPVRGELNGNRRGARVYAGGTYSGAPASGPGTSQVAVWWMKGKFTSPTHFEGKVEYEAATSPPPPYPVPERPQCLDATRIQLDRISLPSRVFHP